MRKLGVMKGAFVGGAIGLALTIAGIVQSAPDGVGLGSGKDGAFTAATAAQEVNAYALLTADVAVAASSLSLVDASAFDVGDVVLVLQTTGADFGSGTANDPAPLELRTLEIGQYDLVRVTSKSGNVLGIAPNLQEAYRAQGAQVVRVPQYTSVDVPAGTGLTARAWDGERGGVLAFLATGAVEVAATGTIDATGKGFRGGNRSNAFCLTGCSSSTAGQAPADDATCTLAAGRGEGFDDRAEAFGATGCGVGARGSGGGGGGSINAGGAGGGNGGPGGRGGRGWNLAAPDTMLGGFPGAAVSGALGEHVTLGGGGGGGQSNDSPAPSAASDTGRGGRGGGVVFFRALSLDATGAIRSNGQRGFDGTSDGAGGGGAGGSVLLRLVDQADCAGVVQANGGNGGNITNHGPGGGGGAGRIRIEARGGQCESEALPGLIGSGNNVGVPGPGAAPSSPVEDAAGVAFGCLTNANCAASAPICDAVVKVCRGCTDGSECPSGTPVCAPTGRCEALPPPDAGPPDSGAGDSGVGDAGVDSGVDAGSDASVEAGVDSGTGADSGTGSDSGAGPSEDGGGTGSDSGAPGTNDGGSSGDDDDDHNPALTTEGGGCDCSTTPGGASSTGAFALTALVAAVLRIARRRRRD